MYLKVCPATPSDEERVPCEASALVVQHERHAARRVPGSRARLHIPSARAVKPKGNTFDLGAIGVIGTTPVLSSPLFFLAGGALPLLVLN